MVATLIYDHNNRHLINGVACILVDVLHKSILDLVLCSLIPSNEDMRHMNLNKQEL